MSNTRHLNIEDRLKRTRPFKLTADTTQLQIGDRKALDKCVSAANTINELYFEQVYDGNLSLIESLKRSSSPNAGKLLQYISIQGGPWDRWHNNEPFIDGVGSKASGANFYPPDLTLAEWENHLLSNPRDATALKSPYTIVRRENNGLRARFFHEIWRARLSSASRELRAASEFCTNPALREFLRQRADALLTDEYAESDAAWIEVAESPIEITIGPYEVYEDALLNLKACYEAVLVVRDSALSGKASELCSYLVDFDAELARRVGYVPHGSKTPMIVGDLYLGAGEISHHGYQTMAYNLPNDEHTKSRHGSKKVFLKNVMHAKFEVFTKQISERLFDSGSAATISRDAFVLSKLGHEIAHGVGPELIHEDDKTVSVKHALGNLYSLLEEAKADVLGLTYLNFLRAKGAVSADSVRRAFFTHAIDIFRTVRFGAHEDHAKGALIQYNWLRRNNALLYNVGKATFSIQDAALVRSLEELANVIMAIQRTGDYKQAKDFILAWSSFPDELRAATRRIEDLPIDIAPIFDI